MSGTDWDLVVIGAGMAGLTAAASAAAQGSRVLVLESAPEIGGSAVLSGGYLWTAPDLATLRAEDPDGDPRLAELVVSRFASAVAWVRSLKTPMEGPYTVLRFGRGYRIDVTHYLRKCAQQVEGADGAVARSTRVQGLIATEAGVTGVRISDGGAHARELAVPAVVLATGGFQGDEALCRRYVSHEPYVLRSNLFSQGDGLRLATDAGGTAAGRMDCFYGHLLVQPGDRPLTVEEFSRFSQYHSDFGILLNTAGNRFTDEAGGDHRNAEALVRQPGGRGLLVIDDEVRRCSIAAPITSTSDPIDRVEDARAAGGRVASAGTLDQLAALVASLGYPREAVLASLRQAFEGPSAVGSWATRKPLPPFHATEVVSGITFTQGGIRTDPAMRAVTSRGEVIPGLLVAGADVGGVYGGGYGGGLALAATTGLVAGETATDKKGSHG